MFLGSPSARSHNAKVWKPIGKGIVEGEGEACQGIRTADHPDQQIGTPNTSRLLEPQWEGFLVNKFSFPT